MSNDHTENWAVRANGDTVDDSVDGVTQKFETGNQGHIQISSRKLAAKGGRVIKNDFARPTMNEWPGVEIFNATDSKRTQVTSEQ